MGTPLARRFSHRRVKDKAVEKTLQLRFSDVWMLRAHKEDQAHPWPSWSATLPAAGVVL